MYTTRQNAGGPRSRVHERRLAVSIFIASQALSAISVAQCGWGWAPGFSPGAGNNVTTMTVFDDGTGPALYIGGGFGTMGGVSTTNGVARWDGLRWSAVGENTQYPPSGVSVLHVWDNGQGPALYAGSRTYLSDTLVNGIARWNGTRWLPQGNGVYSDACYYGLVLCMAGMPPDEKYPHGRLAVGGVFMFEIQNGKTIQMPHNIAAWDGANWSTLGNGLPLLCDVKFGVRALAVFDDGSGLALYAGGANTGASSSPPLRGRIIKFNGTDWEPVGTMTASSCTDLVDWERNGRPALYAIYGTFYTGSDRGRIAYWDGAQWSIVPGTREWSPIEGLVEDLGDGDGETLIVAGSLGIEFGHPGNGIARWNGTAWSTFGTGLRRNNSEGTGYALATFPPAAPGQRTALYVGGFFTTAGGVPSQNIARWAYLGPPGDVNGDNRVDQADLGVLLANFNTTVNPWNLGDRNGDGRVDQADLGILLANFGNTCP